MIHQMATSDNEWQWMTTSESEWQRVAQWVTTSGAKSGNECQRLTTSDNEWKQVTTNDYEWQQMTASGTRNKDEWEQVK